MANEIHSLKIGSTTYPIYAEGVLLKNNNGNSDTYPLLLSSSTSTSSGNYNGIFTDANNQFQYTDKFIKDKFVSFNSSSIQHVINIDGFVIGNNVSVAEISSHGILLNGDKATIKLAAESSYTNYPERFNICGIELLNSANNNSDFYLSTPNDIIFDMKQNSAILGCTINSYGILVSNSSYLGTSTYKWNEIHGIDIIKNGASVSASDERYKDFIDDVNIDFDDIKRIPKKLFTWKEGHFYDGKKIHIGTSAQKVKEIYPELVQTYNTDDCTNINDENAILGVDYEKISIIALAAIDKLNEKIKEIESKIETLQNDNEALLNEINTAENILNNQ